MFSEAQNKSGLQLTQDSSLFHESSAITSFKLSLPGKLMSHKQPFSTILGSFDFRTTMHP